MALVFATANDFKFKEIQAVLEPVGISVWQKKMNLFEKQSDSVSEIAIEKANHAFSKLKLPLIAEDTVVFFEAFHNFPGTRPKRLFQELGFKGLLAKLKGRSRKAFFHTAICYLDYENKPKIFEAKLQGKIAKEVILPDEERMPFEKIFIPKGFEIALSQMNFDEKNAIRHRANATRQLARFLVEQSLAETKNLE